MPSDFCQFVVYALQLFVAWRLLALPCVCVLIDCRLSVNRLAIFVDSVSFVCPSLQLVFSCLLIDCYVFANGPGTWLVNCLSLVDSYLFVNAFRIRCYLFVN